MTPRPSPFREAPRPLRNALEIVLVAGAVLAIAAAACTTDAEAYIAAERERTGLSCDASGHSDGARRTLGKWLFLRAIGAEPAGAGPCHFPLREPTEPGPGGTLLVLVTAAAPVAAAAAVTLGRRARIRGALLGRPALAFVAAVALVAVFVAVALRHRIHATRESLERDFSGYRALCKEYRETAVGDANVLEDTRKALCKSDAGLSLCNAKQDWSEIDKAYETYCSDQPGRTTSACDDYRIHVSNRVKTVQRIPVDSCRDRAEQQPLTGLVALVKRIQPSATKPRPAPEPSAAADTADAGQSSVRGAPGGGPSVDARSDEGADVGDGGAGDAGTTPSTRTVERLEREVLTKHPNLTEQQAKAVVKNMMLGMSLPLALILALLQEKGEPVQEVRERVVRELEAQVAAGEDPKLSVVATDELAEKVKKDPSLVPLLSSLPPTPNVRRVAATLHCAEDIEPRKELCEAKNATQVAGFSTELARSCCQGDHDPTGFAALMCCKCDPSLRGAGCMDLIRMRHGYACTKTASSTTE